MDLEQRLTALEAAQTDLNQQLLFALGALACALAPVPSTRGALARHLRQIAATAPDPAKAAMAMALATFLAASKDFADQGNRTN